HHDAGQEDQGLAVEALRLLGAESRCRRVEVGRRMAGRVVSVDGGAARVLAVRRDHRVLLLNPTTSRPWRTTRNGWMPCTTSTSPSTVVLTTKSSPCRSRRPNTAGKVPVGRSALRPMRR